MDQLKWYEKPLRIAAVQCNYGEDSFDILENHVFKGHFNTEQLLHLNAEGHTSFYKHERDAEKLKKYIEEARKRNIRIILYWNTHCVEKPDRDAHPEWIQKLKNGDEVTAYSNKYLICINSPWVDDFMENFEKVCTLDLDGIFLDGPVVNAQGCHCEACQKKFYEKYGKSIFDATYHEMVEFKVSSVTEYVRKTHELKNSINPNILVYLNNSSLRADVTGSNTTQVEPYVEMVGTEAGFAYINKSYSITHMTPHIKYIETKAKGKPYVIFTAGDNKPNSYYMHTAVETKILYYRSVAHGANIWYGIHAPTYIMKTPGGQAAYECNRFHEKYSDYYLKTVPRNKIAVVWSADTANYYASSVAESDFTQGAQIGFSVEKGNHSASFYGFCEALQRNHVQFDVIDEQTLISDDINKYEMILFPVCACMSDEVVEKVKAYVKNGGNIFATYDTGCYDEKGRRKGADRIKDLFGIESMKGTLKYEIGLSYPTVSEKYAEGLNANVIPGPFKLVECTFKEGVESVAKVNRPMEGRYVAFPDMELEFITINSYGKGKAVYCAGNPDEFIHSHGYSDNIKLVYRLVAEHANTLVKSTAPQSVEMVVRYQKEPGRYMLHLINMTGEMIRPMERLIPITDFDIKLSLPDTISKVSVLDNTLSAELDKDTQTIRIDRLDDYAVLVLE
ncbi:MAG: beta-galactosidase trimerization domain-containing protein [Clostridia bacterium]|nr:family 10 glycosylhydrolase [Clostridiaceae bacterium]